MVPGISSLRRTAARRAEAAEARIAAEAAQREAQRVAIRAAERKATAEAGHEAAQKAAQEARRRAEAAGLSQAERELTEKTAKEAEERAIAAGERRAEAEVEHKASQEALDTAAKETEKFAEEEAKLVGKKSLKKKALEGAGKKMKAAGVKEGLAAAALGLFVFFYQSEDTCKETCQEGDSDFKNSLDENYRKLFDENCENLESQECKDFCNNTDESSDPLGICSQDNRTQRATRQTVQAGVTPIAMAGTALGAAAKGGGEAAFGALFSVFKGIFEANPIVGVVCVLICFGSIIYKANNFLGGGGKQVGNKNIKLYFLFIFFMFILYNEKWGF